MKVHNREKVKLEKMLKEALFSLKNNKNESSHVTAHNLLTCFAPLIDLNPEKFEKYMQQYIEIMKKHEPSCVFKINYQKS